MKNNVLITIFLSIVSVLNAQQDLLSDDKVDEFANYLFLSRQFQFASEEYERLIFRNPQNTDYKLKLLHCYNSNKQIDKGIKLYESFIQDKFVLPQDFHIIYAKMNIQLGQYSALSNSHLINNVNPNLAGNLLLTEHLLEDTRNKEYVFNKSLSYNNGLLILYNQRLDLPSKSPVLAMTMSGVIPGSGKIYTGNWQDGIMSLAFVGVTAFQAYRGFNEKGVNSVYAWLMSGISFSFYLGNIYGSHKAAKSYNDRHVNDYVEKVSDYFDTNF